MKRNNKTLKHIFDNYWIRQLSEAYIRQALTEAHWMSPDQRILDVLNSRRASEKDLMDAMDDEDYGTVEHVVAALRSSKWRVAERALEQWGFRGRKDSPIWRAAIQSDHPDIRKRAREHPDFGTHPSHQAAIKEMEDWDY